MKFLNTLCAVFVLCGLAFFAPCDGRSSTKRIKSKTESTVIRRGKKGPFRKQLSTFGKRVGIFAATVTGVVVGCFVGAAASVTVAAAVMVSSLWLFSASLWLLSALETVVMTGAYAGMIGGGYAGNKLSRKIIGRDKSAHVISVQAVQAE